jgi:multicomponent Na+:H+ antiporter subunit C
MSALPWIVAGWLLLIGLYGIITSRHLVHLIVCLSVVQSSTYVLLLSVGYRTGGIAPIFNDGRIGRLAVDPVVQALTLTDVVVGATVTALLLAMAIQVWKRCDTLDPGELRALHGGSAAAPGKREPGKQAK